MKEEAVALRASFDIRSTMEVSPSVRASSQLQPILLDLQNDFGYYNCVVVNKYGSDWHVVSLSEQSECFSLVLCKVELIQ